MLAGMGFAELPEEAISAKCANLFMLLLAAS
jgi:hypothetical protein